jgi:hypothetical protein
VDISTIALVRSTSPPRHPCEELNRSSRRAPVEDQEGHQLRAYAGFERLEKIPDEVGPNLLSMFQPTPELKPLFDIFVAFLKSETTIGRASAIILAAVKGYWGAALLGLSPGLFIVAAPWHWTRAPGLVFLVC